MAKLTVKQEAFCLAYIETGNASDAYRLSYDAENMKPESINRAAKDLLDNPKITARVSELRAETVQRHRITVDDLVKELQEAREIAKKTDNAAAMTSATMGKAKLLGLDKQIGEHYDRKVTIEWVDASADIPD